MPGGVALARARMAPLDAPQEAPAAWPVSAKAYDLEVRLGTSPSGSSTVWLATCAPDDPGPADVSMPAGGTPKVRRAAVKVVDLEKQSSTSLDLVTREVVHPSTAPVRPSSIDASARAVTAGGRDARTVLRLPRRAARGVRQQG